MKYLYLNDVNTFDLSSIKLEKEIVEDQFSYEEEFGNSS
jgi:hypothetical protein